jgi:CheY-specific phosphatase CheX
MEREKLVFMHKCMVDAFQKVASELTGMSFFPVNELPVIDERKFSLIVGLVGHTNGRVLLELNEKLARKIFESMNGVSPEDDLELYLHLAEFANMISGNGLTGINNMYKGSELRLTPPAVFAGKHLEITNSKMSSSGSSYGTEYGAIRLEIGIEGV